MIPTPRRAFASVSLFVGIVAGTCPVASADAPPAAPREFRAAWVASVNNIDWPSKRGLTTEQQRAEIVAICDRAAELKLNCLIVQMRPAADALYPSKLEPWSVYLTGTAGQAPSPAYDPLETWIDECHRRGIECHVWFNPYRVRMDPKVGLAATSIKNTNPDVVKTYGDKLWLDPGEPLAAKRTLDVFNDVVRRYDVDGIHVDDYFYPYPVVDPTTKKEVPFPDDASWGRYKREHPVPRNPAATNPAQAESMARADWRRQNVNDLIEQIYKTTKQAKPGIKFGISPFGIGRKGKVPGIAGLDQYDALYADAALWLQQGWCDYFVPQLYWPIAARQQSFPVLFEYWRSENKLNRHVYPGLFTSQIFSANPKGFTPGEIVNQIKVTRDRPDAGHVHFSMRSLMHDKQSIASTFKADLYGGDALVPAMPWLDDQAPPAPTARREQAALQLTPGKGEAAFVFGVWTRAGDAWTFRTLPGVTKSLPLDAAVTDVVVTSVDRFGNESPRVTAK